MSKNLDMPFVAGLDQNTDERLATGLLECVNFRHNERGALEPRRGMSRRVPVSRATLERSVTANGIVAGPPRTLLETGAGLLATAGPNFYSLASSATNPNGAWAYRGRRSQFTVERIGLLSTMVAPDAMSFATDGVTILVAYQVATPTGNNVYIAIYDAVTFDALKSDVRIYTTIVPLQSSVKVAYDAVSGLYGIAWKDSTNTTIQAITISTATLLQVSANAALVADVNPVSTFAWATRPGGGFLLAYEQNIVGNYLLKCISSVLAVQGTATHVILGLFPGAMAWDIDCDVAARCWIAIGATKLGAYEVVAWLVNVTTPAAPATVYVTTVEAAAAALYELRAVSIADYRPGPATAPVVTSAHVAFSLHQATGASPEHTMTRSRFVRVGFGAVGNDGWARGHTIAQKIWKRVEAGRYEYFVGVVTGMDRLGEQAGDGFGSSHFLRFENNETLLIAGTPWYFELQANFAVSVTPLITASTVAQSLQRFVSPVVPSLTAAGRQRFLGFVKDGGQGTATITIMGTDDGYIPEAATIRARSLITGGVPLWYDGETFVEPGFPTAPGFDIVQSAGVGIPQGSYAYAVTFQWVDALGEVHYSVAPEKTITLTTDAQVTMLAAPFSISRRFEYRSLVASLEQSPALYQIYRSAEGILEPHTRRTVNYDLVDIVDRFNAFVYTDTLAAYPGPPLYTDGNVLDSVSPPSARFVETFRGRFVLAGTDDDSIWISTEYEQGECPFFSEGLRLAAFEDGPVTGIANLDEKLVIFKSRAVYVVAGDPPNRTGNPASGTLSSPHRISSDAGCIDPQSIVVMPQGVMFRSVRGIYLIDRGLNIVFVGEGVQRETRDLTLRMTSAVLVPEQNQVRFSIDGGGFDAGRRIGKVLVYEYVTQTWTIYELNGGPHLPEGATMHEGAYHWTDTLGDLYREEPDEYFDADAAIASRVRHSWQKPAGAHGYFRAQRYHLLGLWRAPHTLVLNAFKDYDSSAAYGSRIFPVLTAPAAGYDYELQLPGSGRVQSMTAETIIVPVGSPTVPPVTLSMGALELDPLTQETQRRTPASQKG